MGSSLAFVPLLHVGASLSLASFTVHWSTAVGLLAIAGLYEWRARTTAGPRAPSVAARRPYFYAALAVIFFSLNGWLHDLSDWYLFSAHMVQHLLLTLLMPPLLIVGVPGWLLRPLLERPVIGSLARLLTRPKICFAAFSIVVAF